MVCPAKLSLESSVQCSLCSNSWTFTADLRSYCEWEEDNNERLLRDNCPDLSRVAELTSIVFSTNKSWMRRFSNIDQGLLAPSTTIVCFLLSHLSMYGELLTSANIYEEPDIVFWNMCLTFRFVLVFVIYLRQIIKTSQISLNFCLFAHFFIESGLKIYLFTQWKLIAGFKRSDISWIAKNLWGRVFTWERKLYLLTTTWYDLPNLKR